MQRTCSSLHFYLSARSTRPDSRMVGNAPLLRLIWMRSVAQLFKNDVQSSAVQLASTFSTSRLLVSNLAFEHEYACCMQPASLLKYALGKTSAEIRANSLFTRPISMVMCARYCNHDNNGGHFGTTYISLINSIELKNGNIVT